MRPSLYPQKKMNGSINKTLINTQCCIHLKKNIGLLVHVPSHGASSNARPNEEPSGAAQQSAWQPQQAETRVPGSWLPWESMYIYIYKCVYMYIYIYMND